MALTGLFRDAALRQRIAKAYVILGDDPAGLAERLLAAPPQLPEVGGRPCRLFTDRRLEGAVWIDTGPVWLFGPDARERTGAALATAVSLVARRVREFGGLLAPAAYVPKGALASGWLCPDLHAVEVLSDVQRELLTNLLRQHSPTLIALSGRAAHGPAGADPQGSRRLADSGNQVPTRYLTCFSQAHVDRVKESLRRDEGVSDLGLMDINPLGDDRAGVANVSVRLFDAQLLVTSTMAHALLVQAISMHARKLERSGSRLPALPHRLLDLNRSRAIAAGLAAEFETEGGATRKVVTRAASEEALGLITRLLPEFRALGARYGELAPLLSGLVSYGRRGLALRCENDLILAWRRQNTGVLEPVSLGVKLTDPGWLTTDFLSAENGRISPGLTAVIAADWTARLAGAEPGGPRSHRDRPRRSRPAEKPAEKPAGRAADKANGLVQALEAAARDGDAGFEIVTGLLQNYLAGGGDPNLNRHLRTLDRERAKELRRVVRPRREFAVNGELPPDWERAFEIARDKGLALVVVDVPDEQADAAREQIRQASSSFPADLCPVPFATAKYRNNKGARAKVETLIVKRGGSGR